MKNQKHKLKIKNADAFLIFGLCFLFLIFSFSFSFAQTKTLKNIGFVQNNIWYSKDPFFEMDKIRIYTAVFNGSQYDFRGSLEFFVYPNGTGRVSEKSIGKSSFSLISGAFQVLWVDWVAEGGNKKIYANITEAKISLPGGAEETVVLENSKTGEIEIFIDKDSDKDGIGDKNDPKDDRIKANISQILQSSSQGSETKSVSAASFLPSSKEAANLIQGSVLAINTFLNQKKEKAENKKEELQKKLREGESLFEFNFDNFIGKNDNDVEKFGDEQKENKNLLKLYLLALSALVFSLEYKVIIYLLGILIAYRILKFFLKKLFFWHVDKF